jgi:outer membrane protein assembly factor BamB/ubiquinone/menaquinone biosynthesis C-methylase UbiE
MSALSRLASPFLVSLIFAVAFAEGPTNEEKLATKIMEASGRHGGVIVHIGCGDGKLTTALKLDDRFVVQGLDRDAKHIEAARKLLHEQGIYGVATAVVFNGQRLPYAENLVNLIVATGPTDVSEAEMMRVLAPGGAIAICDVEQGGVAITEKPWPDEIDQWTHYLHSASGNPVAHDTVVGPPRHYQWLADPLWQRSHESDSSVRGMVTANGRLFYIVDEGPTSLLGPHRLPDKWFLTARDAFNGVELWKTPIKDWGWQAWKPSWFTPRPGDIPLNIQKRLVAVDDCVYITLGYRAPVSELDARTGEVLRTFEETERTAEILHDGDKLVLSIMPADSNRPRLMAIDLSTGKTQWTSEQDYDGTTTCYYRFTAMGGSVEPAKVDPTLNIATDGRIIALLDGGDVVAVDAENGKERWRATFPLVEADYNAGRIKAGKTLWRGTLIVEDGVVLHASPNQLAAFDAATGKQLWTQPKKYLQHLWFEWMDVFVIDGLVWTWSAELRHGQLVGGGKSAWPATINGYDLHTGETKKKVALGNIFKTHHHHRCYRNKATSNYIIASRRGSEFVDLVHGEHTVDNWLRGTCHLGMMPANGLQYAPPHPCQCYIDEKLNGLSAVAGTSEKAAAGTKIDEDMPRLTRGPRFHPLRGCQAPSNTYWATFRHNSMRTGASPTGLPKDVKLLWRRKIGRKVASPIVVADQVFVAKPDEHQVVALNAETGDETWRFTANGRIDSPPTWHLNRVVVFGSADGHVYCVDAENGDLMWRFRAAPQNRMIAAFGQLESAWPVHGSVLVVEDTVYFAAGRTSQLDGGIWLFALDIDTGEIQNQSQLAGPHYTVEGLDQNYKLPMGTLPDILQGDDQLIYMRDLVFNQKFEQQELTPRETSSRIVAPGGMLDESYFKRIPWSLKPGGPNARMVVHDEDNAYCVRMFDSLKGLDPKVYFTPGKAGYLLFALPKRGGKALWSQRVPVRVNTMAVAGEDLLFAGYPDVVDPNDPLASFEGRLGGVLAARAKADGKELWSHELTAPPAFNGLAVSEGRIYISLRDGSIACFGE